MPAEILDSFALIAYLRDESGAADVEHLLLEATKNDSALHMSEVNYAEVKYSIIRKDGRPAWAKAAAALQALPIEFHPTSLEGAEVAADFKARFRLSLADAFAAALAKERRAALVTGDPEFRALGNEVKIRWLPFAGERQ